MKKIFSFLLIISIIGCSGNENELVEESIDSNMNAENESQELEPSFNFEDYKEFPDSNLKEMNDLLHRIVVAGLVRDEEVEYYKQNLSTIALGEEYERRIDEAGDNPFKLEEAINNSYQEAREYGNSAKNNRKYVFDIDYETYYMLDHGSKPVAAIMKGYDSYEPPLQNYHMATQSFSLRNTGYYLSLESRSDLPYKFNGQKSSVAMEATPSLEMELQELHVTDRQEAEEIQNLLDENKVGMRGRVYIEFIDNDNVHSISKDIIYRIRGIELSFYDQDTNKPLGKAEVFKV